MSSINGADGRVVLNGGALKIFLDDQEIFEFPLSNPDFSGENCADSTVDCGDEFEDENGYVYTANINSHQYGIDYSLEFDDDLEGRVRIELEIYSEDNDEI
jgi:hypothetical protein